MYLGYCKLADFLSLRLLVLNHVDRYFYNNNNIDVKMPLCSHYPGFSSLQSALVNGKITSVESSE